jgi:hypothetical protein
MRLRPGKAAHPACFTLMTLNHFQRSAFFSAGNASEPCLLVQQITRQRLAAQLKLVIIISLLSNQLILQFSEAK